ncbi:kinase-like domain-containing protein [Mycena rosella]|uniref:Kinase-like domain-containing protein n=1 Tax=Mycena rosella TaxID=1033263 RepID=A0AAD7DLX7_MYCRO|nr:kinase-like domain-containing protein [Mycena rosella]
MPKFLPVSDPRTGRRFSLHPGSRSRCLYPTFPSNGIGDTKLHRLIVKLSSACGNFPSSLFLRGVEARAQFPFAAGGFGDIYKAVYQSKPVALKQLRFYEEHTDEERQRIREKFYQEALLWKNLKHPFVIPFIGLYSSENDPNNDNASQSHHLSMSMVCPWMSNGTVLRYLKHCPAARVDIFLLEIAQGLRYLHSQCVVHGDLRGANILVDDEGNARLADFGLASYANATVKSSARAGSLRWMAPELLDPGCLTFRRTFATDVYAFACVCYELYKGEYPFPDIPVDTAVMFEVIAGRRPKRTSIPPQIWELIQACWCDDPGKRLTAPSIVEKLEIIQKINAERLSNGSSLSPTEPPGIYKPPRSLGLSQNGNWTSSLGRTPSLLVNVLPATENLRRRSSGHFDLFSGPSHTPGLDHSQISWRQPARAISMFLKKAKGDVTASVVRTDPGGSRAASQGPIRQRFLSLLPQPTRWT